MIQLGSAYGEIQIGTGDAQKNVSSLASSMRSVGTAMSLAVSAPLAAVGAAGLKAAAGFEQSMNQVQVVSDATAAQMGQLQAVALQLGRDTSFSAGEAAQGLLELAKAGLSADDSMAAIGGVLDLAAAGGLSVASAAEIASNALNSFNLPASEAGRVADLLAAAANSSSIEVTDMAQAFAMSSSVFSSNQQSIEDLSTAIAILGNNGLKGSDAGTSLKTMLMRLTAPTGEAADAMSALGIQVYNADGSMRSFQDVVGQLETATAGLTQEQKNQALTTIFGADAIRAANILIKEGAGEFDNMQASVEQAGAAQLVADARMRGLAGAIAYAKGTIESTLITAFLPLTEALGNLVRRAADLFGKFASLPEPVRNAALAFGAVLAIAGPLLVALPMIGTVLAALLSPIGLVVIAVAGLAAAWAADFGGIREKTAEVWGAIQPMFEGIGGWLQARIPGALTQMQGVWAGVWERAQVAVAALVAFFSPAMERLQAGFTAMLDGLAPLGPQFEGLWAAAEPVLTALVNILGGTLRVAVDLLLNTFAAVMPQIGVIVGAAVDSMTAAFELVSSTVAGLVTLVTALLAGDWAGAWEAAQKIVEGFAAFAVRAVSNFATVAMTLVTALATGLLTTLTDLGVDWKAGWDGIKTATLAMVGAILGTFDSIKTWLETTLQNAVTSFSTFLGALTLPDPFALIKATIGAISGAIDSAKTAMAGFADWLGNLSVPNPFAGIHIPSVSDIGNAIGALGGLITGGKAAGTMFAPAGMTLVGERGPELVEMPRGARVYTADQTRRMGAGAGAGGGGDITINLGGVTVASGMDVEELAWRLAGKIKARVG